MSTKTTFKRVALVAVASLGFGMLSVAPSSAAPTDFALFPIVSALSTPATATIGTPVTGTFNQSGVVNAFGGNSLYTKAFLVAIPVTSALAPNSVSVATYSGSAYTQTSGTTATDTHTGPGGAGGFGFDTDYNGAQRIENTPALVGGTKRINGYFTAAFTPDKAGTYVVAVKSLIDPTQVITWTVTAAAKAAANTTASTAVTSPAGIGAAAGSGTDVDGIYAPKAAAAAVATILVTPGNGVVGAGLANADALSKTATISGPGLISWDAGLTKGRTVASAPGTLIQTLSVYGDGAAGVATITISDSSAQFTKTKTVTFYGAVASYVLTVKNSAISVGSAADDQVLTVAAKDSNGVEVPNSTVYVSSSSTATATVDSATVVTDGDATAADIGVNGVATGAAVITVANASSAATVSATATVNIVKAGIASVVLSFDKAEYSAGEKATITITAKNSDGVLAGDQVYPTLFALGGITSSASLAADVSSVSKTLTNGVATYTVYMPLAVGPVTISAKLGASVATAIQDTVVTATATVLSDGVAMAAQAAAEEATAAANDATDAALSAAEAAEAATAMAQEAVDAVAELSAQVTSLIAALRAQITSLTNLVLKIQQNLAKKKA